MNFIRVFLYLFGETTINNDFVKKNKKLNTMATISATDAFGECHTFPQSVE